MFSALKLMAIALTVIGYVSAFPTEKRGQNVIIGYRTVSAEQAQNYNNAGTLTGDPNLLSEQLGKGVYTTPVRGGWKGNQYSWYCVILAGSNALDRVSKAWVPKMFLSNELWFSSTRIDAYITGWLNSSWDPKKTLRMSIMFGGDGDDDVQLLISSTLLNSNGGGMGLIAWCRKDINDLPDYTVNYDDWQSNIAGSRV